MTTPRLDIAETIGPTLFVGGNDGSNGGKVTSSTTEALEGKQFIGLYFTGEDGAALCPPPLPPPLVTSTTLTGKLVYLVILSKLHHYSLASPRVV